MQQPILHPSMTIRTQSGVQSVELTTPCALVTVTAATLSVMTNEHLQVIRWEDLIDMLNDLDRSYTTDEAMKPAKMNVFSWLVARPGVQIAGNGHAGHA